MNADIQTTNEALKEIGAILRKIRNQDPEDWQFQPASLKEIAERVNELGWFHSSMEDIDSVLMALSEIE